MIGDSSTSGCVCYLRRYYASLTPTIPSSHQWPPVIANHYYELAMIKHNHRRTNKTCDSIAPMEAIDNVLSKYEKIELQNLFPSHPESENQCRRELVLIEGVPGCGKTTLSVHIAQKVSEGQLFAHLFSTAILVQLRNLKYPITSIADMLSYITKDSAMSQKLAKSIQKNNGRGVLLILDGWDELPLEYRTNQESVLYKLIRGDCPQNISLFESAIIVTSRPIASSDLQLSMIPFSRIEIVGFTPENLEKYFVDCFKQLKLNNDEIIVIQERIQANPSLTGICSLPLNASILVHISTCWEKEIFTATHYGILSEIILSCIAHDQGYNSLSQLSLKNLTGNLKSQFLGLCKLAYDGVFNDQIKFSDSQLSSCFSPNSSASLGLLQGIKCFLLHEVTTFHQFFHVSVQELLAAHHIVENFSDNPEAQVSEFDKSFHSSHFNTVCWFYAAITELKTPGIDEVLNRKAAIFGERRPSEDKSLLLSLLHCLHEAQNISLCQSVASKLQYGLDLRCKTLSSSDCLSVGFFLSSVVNIKFKVNLDCCSIGDQGCRYLTSILPKSDGKGTTLGTQFSLSLERNDITFQGIKHLCILLTCGYSLYHFSLSHNHLPGNGQHELSSSKAITVRRLDLSDCSLNAENAANLINLLINNEHIQLLNLSNNALHDSGIQSLSQAFILNQTLKEIDLHNCGIKYKGFESLACSLQINKSIEEIYLHNYKNDSEPNLITEDIVPILIECLSQNKTLIYLALPMELNDYTTAGAVQEAVNGTRKEGKLLKISGIIQKSIAIIINCLLLNFLLVQGNTLSDIKDYITRKRKMQVEH